MEFDLGQESSWSIISIEFVQSKESLLITTEIFVAVEVEEIDVLIDGFSTEGGICLYFVLGPCRGCNNQGRLIVICIGRWHDSTSLEAIVVPEALLLAHIPDAAVPILSGAVESDVLEARILVFPLEADVGRG